MLAQIEEGNRGATMGVGSEIHEAIVLKRKGVGVELKPSYYAQSVKNINSINDEKVDQIDIFSSEEINNT